MDGAPRSRRVAARPSRPRKSRAFSAKYVPAAATSRTTAAATWLATTAESFERSGVVGPRTREVDPPGASAVPASPLTASPRPVGRSVHGHGAFAVTLPEPPGPVAEIVQVSPAAPIANGVVPEHGSEPLPAALPVQSNVHAVASLQSHVTLDVGPQPSNEPVHRGGRQVATTVAAPVPPTPVPVMVQVSPAAPTANGVEPEHAIAPPAEAVPEQA